MLKPTMTFMTSLVATAFLVISCQAPVSVGTGSLEGPMPATMTLDAVQIIDNLASKPNRNWQDGALRIKGLVERQKAMAEAAKYKLLAPTNGSLSWTYQLPAGASTVVPTYLKEGAANEGPGSYPGDRLFALSNSGTLYRINPVANPAGAPPPAVQAASSMSLGAYANTALALSGDNKRLYALTTDGYFKILDPVTLTVLYTSAQLNVAGFNGTAPFIDYGVNTSGGNTVFGSIETVYAVSTAGSIHKIRVDQSTATLNVSVASAAAATFSYATHAAPAGYPVVQAFPVAWKNKVYYGTTKGVFYVVDMTTPATPTFASYNLAAATTAISTGKGMAITAPAALDFDDNLNVTHVFAACGDRLNWIKADGTVVASPSLTLDRIPPAGGGGVANALSAYVPSAVNPATRLNPTDFASIKTRQLPVPTRWSGPTAPLASGISATSVRIDGAGSVWVADYANDRVQIYRTDGTMTNIPVNNAPTKLEFDGLGNCWVACGGYSSNGNQGWVEKISAAGVRQTTGGFPIVFTGAVYVAPTSDATGACWVTDPYQGRVVKFNANGTQAFAPKALGTAAAIFCDQWGYAWVMPYGGTTVRRYLPDGSNFKDRTVGNAPFGIAFRYSTTPPEAWVTLNGAAGPTNTLAILDATPSTTGTPALLRTLPTAGNGPVNPWSIRFDAAGNPWTSNTQLGSNAVMSVTELNINGTINTTYPLKSPANGQAADYGNPYELVFDSVGNTYAACSSTNFTTGALINITSLGNLQDLFASTGVNVLNDGDESYALMKFKIPKDSYASRVPVRTQLKLTPNGGSPAGESVSLFTASNRRVPGGVQWVGFPAAPASVNVDWNARPAIDPGGALSTLTGTFAANTAYYFDVPHTADQVNEPALDAGQALVTYGVQSTAKPLTNTVHWYSTTTAGATTAYRPTLEVDLAGGATLPTTSGIQSQPTIDYDNSRVFVSSCNAMFELSYASEADWQRRDRVFYNLTTGGQTTGPVLAGNFVFPKGNVLLTYDYRLVVPEFRAAAGALFLNTFDVSTSRSKVTDRLDKILNLTPGNGTIGTQMLFDYTDGHVYAVTSNNYVVRANILQ